MFSFRTPPKLALQLSREADHFAAQGPIDPRTGKVPDARSHSNPAERFYLGSIWRCFADDLNLKCRNTPDLRFFSQSKNPLRMKAMPGRGIPVLRAQAGCLDASRGSKILGFSLVEVVIALGLFAFAIVPLIGLMGGGLKISEDSIQSANLAEIYRHASARIASTPTATDIDPMYFTFSGEQATNADSRIYHLAFSNVSSVNDAASGLVSRKVWRLRVTRAANTNLVLDEHFIMLNQDPVDALR